MKYHVFFAASAVLSSILMAIALLRASARAHTYEERLAPICTRVHDDVTSARRDLLAAGATMKARGISERLFVELGACTDFNDRAYEDAMNNGDVTKVIAIYDHLLRDTENR